MRLHRFFVVQSLKNGLLKITDRELLHQWHKVLRLKDGDRITLLDGSGFEADAMIDSLNPSSASLTVSHLREVHTEPARHVRLYCAVLQRGNMELVVQKATEVGVKEIIPLVTERTIKTGLKMDRFQKIMREAVEQCGRGVLPMLAQPQDFARALQASLLPFNVFFHLEAADAAWTDQAKHASRVGLWIGPEGGWTDAEIALADRQGFLMGSLGSLALRAETAAIVAAHAAIVA